MIYKLINYLKIDILQSLPIIAYCEFIKITSINRKGSIKIQERNSKNCQTKNKFQEIFDWYDNLMNTLKERNEN